MKTVQILEENSFGKDFLQRLTTNQEEQELHAHCGDHFGDLETHTGAHSLTHRFHFCESLPQTLPPPTHSNTHARLAGLSGRLEARAFSHLHNEAFVGVRAAPTKLTQRLQQVHPR